MHPQRLLFGAAPKAMETLFGAARWGCSLRMLSGVARWECSLDIPNHFECPKAPKWRPKEHPNGTARAKSDPQGPQRAPEGIQNKQKGPTNVPRGFGILG